MHPPRRTEALKGPGDRAARLAWALARWPEVWVLLGPAIYLALALAPPLLDLTGREEAARFVFGCFRGLCHQLPERTFHLDGHPMAVCARCAALPLGIVLGAIVAGRMCAWLAPSRWVRPGFVWILIAAVPMALDGFSQLFGFRESTNGLRLATGLILGAAVAAWAVPIVAEALDAQRPVPHEPDGSTPG